MSDPVIFGYPVFRRCPSCSQLDVVREQYFVCVFCDAEPPEAWNV